MKRPGSAPHVDSGVVVAAFVSLTLADVGVLSAVKMVDELVCVVALSGPAIHG